MGICKIKSARCAVSLQQLSFLFDLLYVAIYTC